MCNWNEKRVFLRRSLSPFFSPGIIWLILTSQDRPTFTLDGKEGVRGQSCLRGSCGVFWSRGREKGAAMRRLKLRRQNQVAAHWVASGLGGITAKRRKTGRDTWLGSRKKFVAWCIYWASGDLVNNHVGYSPNLETKDVRIHLGQLWSLFLGTQASFRMTKGHTETIFQKGYQLHTSLEAADFHCQVFTV